MSLVVFYFFESFFCHRFVTAGGACSRLVPPAILFKEPASIQRNPLGRERTDLLALFAPFVGSSMSSLPFAVFPDVAVGLGPRGTVRLRSPLPFRFGRISFLKEAHYQVQSG